MLSWTVLLLLSMFLRGRRFRFPASAAWPGIGESLLTYLRWLPLIVLLAWIGNLLFPIRSNPLIMELVRNFRGGINLPVQLALVFFVLILGPLAEEAYFRGVLYPALLGPMNRPIAALASAGVFALLHGPGAFPAVFLLGLILVRAYERERTLAAPLAVHVAHNLLALLACLLLGEI